jgi:hypothetical protein
MPPPGLFITARETDILRLVAHSWLLLHITTTARKELPKERRRRPSLLFAVRSGFHALIAVASAVTAAHALWQLTS